MFLRLNVFFSLKIYQILLGFGTLYHLKGCAKVKWQKLNFGPTRNDENAGQSFAGPNVGLCSEGL
jgi:hypothetical protein